MLRACVNFVKKIFHTIDHSFNEFIQLSPELFFEDLESLLNLPLARLPEFCISFCGNSTTAQMIQSIHPRIVYRGDIRDLLFLFEL